VELHLYSPPPPPSAWIASYSETNIGVRNLVNTSIVNTGLTAKNPTSEFLKLKNYKIFFMAEISRLCLTDIFNRNKHKVDN